MNLKQLAEAILALPAERQLDDATVHVKGVDESYAVLATEITHPGHATDGVLDEGHFVIVI